MFHDTTFPPPDDRLVRLMRELNALDRTTVEAAIDAMIARLDADDGDPDLEDSETGDSLVNDRGRRLDYRRLSDHRSSDDEPEDVAYPEWHSRGRQKLYRHGAETPVGCVGHVLEDDEDDDPAEQDDEPEEDDDAGGNILDERHDEEERHEDDDPEARQRHRDRIRRTRCDYVRVGIAPHGWWEYRLRCHQTGTAA